MTVTISDPSQSADPSDTDARDWAIPADAWPDGFDDPWSGDWDDTLDPEQRFQYPIGLP
jgi:hypothetical protein